MRDAHGPPGEETDATAHSGRAAFGRRPQDEWMKRRPASIGGLPAYRANSGRRTAGGHPPGPLRERLGRSARPAGSQSRQARTLFDHLQRRYRGALQTDRCGPCSGGSSNGARPPSRPERFSSPSTTPGNSALPTSVTCRRSGSRSSGGRSRTCSTTSCSPTRTGRRARSALPRVTRASRPACSRRSEPWEACRSAIAPTRSPHPSSHAGRKRELTHAYQGLLAHYGLAAEATNPRRGNENGDVEQRHHRFKSPSTSSSCCGAAATLSRAAAAFLEGLFTQPAPVAARARGGPVSSPCLPSGWAAGNCGRGWGRGRRSASSTIPTRCTAASSASGWSASLRRAPGSVVWAAQSRAASAAAGRAGHRIEYRHVIDWLVRSPALCELPLPRGPLPDQPVPHLPRRPGGAPARHGQQAIPGDPATGGAGERDRVDESLRALLMLQEPADRGGGGGAGRGERTHPLGDPGGGRPGGPGRLRHAAAENREAA